MKETDPLGGIFYSYTYYRPKEKRYSYMTGNGMTYDYDIGGLDALYHSDHLGSTSWKNERFGKPFASERADEARSGKEKQMNTWVIKSLCIIVFCIFGQSLHAQYILEHSDNYPRELNNPEFCHTYKIDGYWSQTYIYYEMIDKNQFNNKIEIVNKSYGNEWGFYFIQLHIDQKDTLICATSDSSEYVSIRDSIPKHISLTIFGRSGKIQVPINEKEIPSKITILWGNNDTHGILTIRSKRKLDEETILSIQRDVSVGRHPYHYDEYYYFISKNPQD